MSLCLYREWIYYFSLKTYYAKKWHRFIKNHEKYKFCGCLFKPKHLKNKESYFPKLVYWENRWDKLPWETLQSFLRIRWQFWPQFCGSRFSTSDRHLPQTLSSVVWGSRRRIRFAETIISYLLKQFLFTIISHLFKQFLF